MKNGRASHHPETDVAQALGALDEAGGGVVPAMHLSATYRRDESYAPVRGRIYSRDENPTYLPAEALLAKLEGGVEAKLFASGMNAATSLLSTLVPGDHVVSGESMYFTLRAWLKALKDTRGVDVTFVDASKPGAIAGATIPGRTRLVWIETPANPLWDIVDIRAAADAAHAVSAELAVDSTIATPVHTRPVEHGADYVMHSATKALNGHSDVIAGALVTKAHTARWERVKRIRYETGAVLGAFEAWLLLRGMRTLFLRVERASANAMDLAQWLSAQPGVTRVRYPGLPSHPDHAIAARQMTRGFGHMLSFHVEGGADRALAIASKLQLFQRATSLGSVESLVEHRATVEGAATISPPDMLRLSIGVEHVDDLRADLDQALR